MRALHRLRDRLLAPAAALMAPPAGLAFDYAQPRGAPALVGPHSLSWRIFKNPVTLFIGGVAAVLLELAEPSVRTGVWEHSSFRRDPLTRLRRTGAAAMMTVYGPRNGAERMIAGVVRAHERVRGTTPGGQAYEANDQRLLDWVQATASYGFIWAYHRFAAPLSLQERSAAFAEASQAARLYGARGAPQSVEDWETLLAQTAPGLEASDIVFEFLEILERTPILPGPLRPLQRLLIAAAVDLVPAPQRALLGLSEAGLNPAQRALVAAMARLADKVPLPGTPPTQSSLRMGLAADHLYR